MQLAGLVDVSAVQSFEHQEDWWDTLTDMKPLHRATTQNVASKAMIRVTVYNPSFSGSLRVRYIATPPFIDPSLAFFSC